MITTRDLIDVSPPLAVSADGYYGFVASADDLSFAARALVDAGDKLAVPDKPLSRRQAFARSVVLAEIEVAQAAIGRAKAEAERAARS